MIDIKDMSFAYNGQEPKVFSHFNLQVKKGQFLAVTGESGCGKTTLMNLITRNLSCDSGKIVIAGQDVSTIRDTEIFKLRRKIGMVFQDVKLLEDRSIYDNLSFCARALEMHKDAEFNRITSILKLMGLLDYHKKMPSQLSGGQRTKVAIARALMSNPSIFLCDEPTGNLDQNSAEEIIKLLKIIQQQGTCILLATHDVGLIDKYNIEKILLTKEGNS